MLYVRNLEHIEVKQHPNIDSAQNPGLYYFRTRTTGTGFSSLKSNSADIPPHFYIGGFFTSVRLCAPSLGGHWWGHLRMRRFPSGPVC